VMVFDGGVCVMVLSRIVSIVCRSFVVLPIVVIGGGVWLV